MDTLRVLLALLSLGAVLTESSELTCTKLKRNRKNRFPDRGYGRMVTYTLRRSGVMVGDQNLGMVFFLGTGSEPMYGVEMTVSQTADDTNTVLLKFMSVIRRGSTPCDTWPAVLLCSSDTSGPLQEERELRLDQDSTTIKENLVLSKEI